LNVSEIKNKEEKVGKIENQIIVPENNNEIAEKVGKIEKQIIVPEINNNIVIP